MPRTVYCTFLKREAQGLERVPYPGELGKRIYENISAEAWQQWVRHQTMLLNEYRLSPIEPKARKFLVEEMEKFLFGDGIGKAGPVRRDGSRSGLSGRTTPGMQRQEYPRSHEAESAERRDGPEPARRAGGDQVDRAGKAGNADRHQRR